MGLRVWIGRFCSVLPFRWHCQVLNLKLAKQLEIGDGREEWNLLNTEIVGLWSKLNNAPHWDLQATPGVPCRCVWGKPQDGGEARWPARSKEGIWGLGRLPVPGPGLSYPVPLPVPRNQEATCSGELAPVFSELWIPLSCCKGDLGWFAEQIPQASTCNIWGLANLEDDCKKLQNAGENVLRVLEPPCFSEMQDQWTSRESCLAWAEASIRYFSFIGNRWLSKKLHGAVVELIYSLKSSVFFALFLSVTYIKK